MNGKSVPLFPIFELPQDGSLLCGYRREMAMYGTLIYVIEESGFHIPLYKVRPSGNQSIERSRIAILAAKVIHSQDKIEMLLEVVYETLGTAISTRQSMTHLAAEYTGHLAPIALKIFKWSSGWHILGSNMR
uniref:Transposase n=1 Tax=Steinernema glaseri TaxID=37863 RepID=A0A1I7YEQ0_9BILA